MTRGLASALLLLVFLGSAIAVSSEYVELDSQTLEEQLLPETRDVFAQIAQIYRIGSEAPELVARLNSALESIQEAQLRRMEGNESGASILEEQARIAVSEVRRDLPAAQQRAQYQSTVRAFMVIGSVPIIVALSTLAFYGVLKARDWYDRTKLFEMMIVEKRDREES